MTHKKFEKITTKDDNFKHITKNKQFQCMFILKLLSYFKIMQNNNPTNVHEK